MVRCAKVQILLCALVALVGKSAVAQYPYTHHVDAVAKDMTFRVMRAANLFMTLDNVQNELGDQPIVWNDGTRLTVEEYENLILGDIDAAGVYKAIQATFTEQEYKVLEQGRDRMEVALVVGPDGKVLEVGWSIYVTPRTDAITPDKFAEFERNIKRYVTYSVTEDMRRVPYFRTIHNFNFGLMKVLYKNEAIKLPTVDALQGDD